MMGLRSPFYTLCGMLLCVSCAAAKVSSCLFRPTGLPSTGSNALLWLPSSLKGTTLSMEADKHILDTRAVLGSGSCSSMTATMYTL